MQNLSGVLSGKQALGRILIRSVSARDALPLPLCPPLSLFPLTLHALQRWAAFNFYCHGYLQPPDVPTCSWAVLAVPGMYSSLAEAGMPGPLQAHRQPRV